MNRCVCCRVLQCVAVCCSVLQCVAVYCSDTSGEKVRGNGAETWLTGMYTDVYVAM